MCGIVGFVDFHKKLKVKDLETLIDTLSHRGPDDNGNFFINTQTSNIGIGHTRLTILDPSKRGKQPMTFEDLIISFNGEIYNFEEIRNLLIKTVRPFNKFEIGKPIIGAITINIDG